MTDAADLWLEVEQNFDERVVAIGSLLALQKRMHIELKLADACLDMAQHWAARAQLHRGQVIEIASLIMRPDE